MGADCGFTVELFTFSFDIPVTRFSGQMEPAITAADGGISRVVTAGGMVSWAAVSIVLNYLFTTT